MKKIKISPSLMCMDFLRFREQIEFFAHHADYLHIDIMDGHYVPNFALFPDIIRPIPSLTSVPMDTHLMVTEPSRYLEMMAKAGARYISPQAERINRDAFRVIDVIRTLGCRVGVVLNPATPLDTIRHYLPLLDKITIMTVDPGFAGQKFIPEMLNKIEEARLLRERKGLSFEIEIDGSCNRHTFKALIEAGADVLIVGSSGLFSLDQDLARAWRKMQEALTEAGAEIGIGDYA